MTVTGMSRRYGDNQALVDVSFSVHEHEILGIIGPNGAGKTTLLECMAGLLPADAGELRFRGQTLSPRQRKAALFYLPDGIAPWAELAVFRLVDLFRELFGGSHDEEQLLIDRLGLAPVLAKTAGSLSKGYQRRLLLALALLTPQPVLLLDEPFDGFDLRQTLAVMALLRELAKGPRTFVLSIHQLGDAQRICDRLLLLDTGKRLGCGTLADLRQQAGLTQGGLEEVFLALT